MGKKRKAGRKILAGVLAGSMIFYCSSYTTVLSAKSAAVVKKGYTISKKAGKYTKSVTVKVKAKKGYTVYYTTGKNLSVKKKIKAKKTKSFTFKSTKTLKIYAVKASKKVTKKTLKKVKKSSIAKYKYTIVKKTKATATPAATAGQNSTTATAAPTAGTTAVPTVTPGGSQYVGDDAAADYVAPARTTYTAEDTDVSSDGTTEITMASKATGSKVPKENYEISKKNKLTITAPGTYTIHSEEGATTDGLIDVKFSDDTMTGTVHLILDGVRLTSGNNTAPDSDTGLITIKSNVTKAVITVADGSENTLTDTGATGVDADDNTSTTYTAGIVCKKTPLTINGKGTLNITSTNGNGIKCTDDLKIIDTTVKVSGPSDAAAGHNGITGKTGLSLKNAAVTIHSNQDGLKTTLDETDVAADSSLAELGNMEIDGGTIDIVSENGDAISVYRTLYLNPITLQVTTKNAAASTADGSYKGIKAGTTIYIPETAGTITADTTATYSSSRVQRDSNDPVADDSIHCDGYIRIDGGILTLSSGDDGIHSDSGLVVNGGTIVVKESYEGLESGDITVNGGNITVTSKDDGFNAAGGSNSTASSSGSQFPGDNFNKGDSSSNTQYQIIINGGTINVNAEGDGIDSNGNIFFKGGTVIVNGPTNGGNGALDYGDSSDCVCEISGGTLIAAGAVGMDAAPTSGSSQPAVNVRLSSSQSAGTYVVLKDSSGNTVLTAQPSKTFQSVVMSCEALKLGSTYTVYYGKDLSSLTQGDSVTFTSASMSTGSSSGGGWNPGGNPGGNQGGNRPGGR